jgi:mono/diheme cytochrome c family protein
MKKMYASLTGTYGLFASSIIFFGLTIWIFTAALADAPADKGPHHSEGANTQATFRNASHMVVQGQQIFRFDTFGDEAFWGDTLELHRAIEGERFGGVGRGLSPTDVLGLGLKVDAQALPRKLIENLRHGRVDLNSPAVTLELLKFNAVVGVKGTFNPDGSLKTVGLTCAVCHSTVNDSVAAGIGERLDGWANRDLNPGAIIAAVPNISPVTSLLRIVHPTITDEQVRAILNGWGPGKFDAELLFDGKAAGPNGPSATLIPNAFGLAGFNLHTWTGGWGTVTYWNALVAVLEMHGVGTFFDERLDDTNKFPIAATMRFGHTSVDNPDDDRVTSKLPPLHFFQLSIPAPKPTPGTDFNAAAAARGDELFSGKANCNSCHREPLWTEPGWNDHSPAEMGIDSFQADRSPDGNYKTMNLAGLFVRERGLFMKPENKGRFYHDGRFATLLDVVKSYNSRFTLNLTDQEELDLVEYLKSL